MKLYGIPNCSTVKKARSWLEQQGAEYQFHDFKKHGLTAELAEGWLIQLGWERLINRNGLTWRGLAPQQKLAIQNNDAALRLILEKPSVIKRPLLEQDGKLLHSGFDEVTYSRILNS